MSGGEPRATLGGGEDSFTSSLALPSTGKRQQPFEPYSQFRDTTLLYRLNIQSWSASIFIGEMFAIFMKTEPELPECPSTLT